MIEAESLIRNLSRAFERSSFEGMLNYYRRNYPRAPYEEGPWVLARVERPVLLIHGLDDQFLLSSALSGTWDWIDADLTLVTVPRAGHFVQHDAADLVSRSIRAWLDR